VVRAIRNDLGPHLAADEQLILHSQGGYKENVRSAWKLGQFYLTSERLIFFVPVGILFQVALADIESIDVEQARFALGRWKDVIARSCSRWRCWKSTRKLSTR
jgi:hypothetical protein